MPGPGGKGLGRGRPGYGHEVQGPQFAGIELEPEGQSARGGAVAERLGEGGLVGDDLSLLVHQSVGLGPDAMAEPGLELEHVVEGAVGRVPDHHALVLAVGETRHQAAQSEADGFVHRRFHPAELAIHIAIGAGQAGAAHGVVELVEAHCLPCLLESGCRLLGGSGVVGESGLGLK